MIEKLNSLIKEWERNGNFFDGPDDGPINNAMGQTYKECAKQLKEIVSEHLNDADHGKVASGKDDS